MPDVSSRVFDMSLSGESVRRVRVEKGGGASNVGCVGSARATRDYGKNVDFCTRPVLANGIGEGGIFVTNHVCGVGEVIVYAIFPFPCLNIFHRVVSSASVRVADEYRFEEPDEVGFVCRGSQHRGEYLVRKDGMA
jgi:hypothetical protein